MEKIYIYLWLIPVPPNKMAMAFTYGSSLEEVRKKTNLPPYCVTNEPTEVFEAPEDFTEDKWVDITKDLMNTIVDKASEIDKQQQEDEEVSKKTAFDRD
jgi:hypothetical protein